MFGELAFAPCPHKATARVLTGFRLDEPGPDHIAFEEVHGLSGRATFQVASDLLTAEVLRITPVVEVTIPTRDPLQRLPDRQGAAPTEAMGGLAGVQPQLELFGCVDRRVLHPGLLDTPEHAQR